MSRAPVLCLRPESGLMQHTNQETCLKRASVHPMGASKRKERSVGTVHRFRKVCLNVERL